MKNIIVAPVLAFLFVNIVGAVGGWADALNVDFSTDCRQRGKWVYVVPAYGAVCRAINWMNEDFKK